VGVSLEALSTKPVALAPVETTIKIGVHIYLLPTHKKRGVSAPTLGEQIPPKKAKRQGLPRLLAWLFCLGYKRQALTGCLARCGCCGKALVGQDAKSGQFTYYVCGTLLKKGSGSCPTRYLNSRQFEGLIIDKIKEHVLTTENLTRLVHIVNEEMDNLAAEYHQRLDIVLNEIADVNRRLERLYDALETGKIQLVDLAPRIQQLRQQRELSLFMYPICVIY